MFDKQVSSCNILVDIKWLLNYIQGWSKETLIGTLIGCPEEEITIEFRFHQPLTFTGVVELNKM